MDPYGGSDSSGAVSTSYNRVSIVIQRMLDRATPFIALRWLFNLFLLVLFALRIFFIHGFYIIAYGLGIFLLNQFILFLTPKQDPSLSSLDNDDDHAPTLPTRANEEFRPFMRRLPEFKFWNTTLKALIISLLTTLFDIFDVPVFWPVLVIYFFTLFFLTMRQRIAHMIQFRYVPFSYGKVRYQGKNDLIKSTGNVIKEMGIHNLAKLIADQCPQAIKEGEMKTYFGRKIAIDASMSIYQFLIAVRQDGQNLTNENGETTSHLMGMFYRTIRMVENGLKPVFVFDGKPPQMKSQELQKRQEKRSEAESEVAKAAEAGDEEAFDKFSRRTVKVTREHNEECKRLLKLMGIPYVDAPTEAEAQCAALCKAGKVYAVGTEDMDALTFGANVLVRHLTFSEARKMPIREYSLAKVLQGLDLSTDEFVDLCILLGCDYCDSIKGIGQKRALELVKQYRTIETVLKHIDKKKHPIPEEWPFEEARQLFKTPDVIDGNTVDLKWDEPDEAGLIEYMVKDKGFNKEN
ncbi:unnamed protein product [Didymodactylos carnosus]|uniref:Flap endonuclease 1 n=1 Tax=Didymodactylos carnosus TaxID=1234261 RepID=A0A814JFA3_9BILA|nr:unnamed protein product [Didymodactylos carnosus]CAF1036831.1 unnamed protein product [Didymodactylos carnosus]CAF3558263.1 unnamed protein product [Didymodactylos carnosus]CAF3807357.1 unnamed protein product [Didymodactylos carnosus]